MTINTPKGKPLCAAMAALVTSLTLALPATSHADPWDSQAGSSAAFLPDAVVTMDTADQIQGQGVPYGIYVAVINAAHYCTLYCQSAWDLGSTYYDFYKIAREAARDRERSSRYQRMDSDDFVRAWLRAEGVRIPRDYMNY